MNAEPAALCLPVTCLLFYQFSKLEIHSTKGKEIHGDEVVIHNDCDRDFLFSFSSLCEHLSFGIKARVSSIRRKTFLVAHILLYIFLIFIQ